MKSYSLRLARMAAVLAALAAAAFLGAAWWQHHQEQVTGSVFRPQGRIDRIQRVLQALDERHDGRSSQNAAAAGAELEKCSPRQRALLEIRVAVLEDVSPEQSREMMKRAARSLAPDGESELNCSVVLSDVMSALRYRRYLKGVDGVPPMALQDWLSETLDWRGHQRCIEAQAPDGRVLLAGNPWRCGPAVAWLGVKESGVRGSWRDLALKVTQDMRSATAAPTGAMTAQVFTPDLALQAWLDRWSECGTRGSACPGTAALVDQMQSASVVVMDVDSGDILGLMCTGVLCQGIGPGVRGPAAALLLESPAASTVKLVHALTLAGMADRDTREIERQIKTSVQLDDGVSKRNEWWERQVICDPATVSRAAGETSGSKSVASTGSRSCQTMAAVQAVANELLFNRNCPSQPGSRATLMCGRVGLAAIDDPGLLSGFLGRIGWDWPQGRQQHMSWADYDAIRQGTAKPPVDTQGQRRYAATSQAVQSVIGSGDTRISALGLANLGANLWRQAEGLPVVPPRLLRPARPVFDHPSAAPTAKPAKTSKASAASAASVVMQGMARVVEPEESGWKGAGTAHSALKAAFGQSCAGLCGLRAKTGTVSFKDPSRAGSTLLVMTADMSQTVRWLGRPGATLQGHRLALGVIVQPKQVGQGGHLASQLGMQLIKGLIQ